MDRSFIENCFTYHAPTPEKKDKFPILRSAARELAYIINDIVPDGREKSLAITKLQETVMWANTGIALSEDGK